MYSPNTYLLVYRYVASTLFIGGLIGFLDLARRPSFCKTNLNAHSKLYLVISAGLLSAAAAGLMIYGQSLTTSINASLISTGVILSTALFAFIVTKEKLSSDSKLWLPIMFVGLYIATVGLNGLGLNKGDIIIALSILIYGLNNAITKLAVNYFDPVFTADAFWMIGGVIHFTIAAIIYGPTFFINVATVFIIIAATAGWLNGISSNKAIYLIGPNKWIVLNMTHVILTMIFATILLAEVVTISRAIGASIILLAIYKMNTRHMKVKM